MRYSIVFWKKYGESNMSYGVIVVMYSTFPVFTCITTAGLIGLCLSPLPIKNILEWKMKRTHILPDIPCSRIPIIVDGFMIKSVLFGASIHQEKKRVSNR